MTNYEVLVFGDLPPARGADAEGGLTNAHPVDGGYRMGLRTAKALVRQLEARGLFAAVINPETMTVVWTPR